jgi:hypothetical protein
MRRTLGQAAEGATAPVKVVGVIVWLWVSRFVRGRVGVVSWQRRWKAAYCRRGRGCGRGRGLGAGPPGVAGRGSGGRRAEGSEGTGQELSGGVVGAEDDMWRGEERDGGPGRVGWSERARLGGRRRAETGREREEEEREQATGAWGWPARLPGLALPCWLAGRVPFPLLFSLLLHHPK